MSTQKGRKFPSSYIFNLFLERYPAKRDSVMGYEVCKEKRNAIKVYLPRNKTWFFQITDHGGRVRNSYLMQEVEARLQPDNAVVPAEQNNAGQYLITEAMKLSPEEIIMCIRLMEKGRIAILPDVQGIETLFWLRGDQIVPVTYVGDLGGFTDRDRLFHVTFVVTTKEEHFYENRLYKAGEAWRLNVEEIGKELFLTYDEAENALKNKNKKG